MAKIIISVKNLVKNYGSFQAVKGISFDVMEGEIFGLLGPNGAGKSTTLEIIETLRTKTSGDIVVDGLLPDAIAIAEVATDECRLDPGVERSGIESKQSPLPISRNRDRQPVAFVFRLHPVHERKHLLQFIADDVAAHLVTHPINPLPMRDVGLDAETGAAGEFVSPTHQRRDDDLAAKLHEAQRHPRSGSHTLGQPSEHFRRLVGIGKHNDARFHFALGS